MQADNWYWLIMFIWVLASLWGYRVPGQPYPWDRAMPPFLLTFLLFVLIGLKLFGSIVK